MKDLKISEENFTTLNVYADLFANEIRELAGKSRSEMISKNDIMYWVVKKTLPAYEDMKKKEESEENGK